jgi:acetyl esterase/lipase
MIATLRLLTSRPQFSLRGLLLHFGCFDVSLLASSQYFTKPLVLNYDIMVHYIKVLFPNESRDGLRNDPIASPLWANLAEFRGRLPNALLTCGTEDCLLDDSVIMAARWGMYGGNAVLKIYPGAPHGFLMFPDGTIEAARQGREDTKTFVLERL